MRLIFYRLLCNSRWAMLTTNVNTGLLEKSRGVHTEIVLRKRRREDECKGTDPVTIFNWTRNVKSKKNIP